MNFLSERNIALHKGYARGLGNRFSIFEKSYPDLVGKDARGISRARIARAEREEALLLFCEREAHKLFFSSFGEGGARCERLRGRWGSEAGFLYELLSCAREREGFLIIYTDGRGGIGYYAGREYRETFLVFEPILALDLCEHAYFLDYGFDKYTYLKTALSHLSLSKITNKVAKSGK